MFSEKSYFSYLISVLRNCILFKTRCKIYVPLYSELKKISVYLITFFIKTFLWSEPYNHQIDFENTDSTYNTNHKFVYRSLDPLLLSSIYNSINYIENSHEFITCSFRFLKKRSLLFYVQYIMTERKLNFTEKYYNQYHRNSKMCTGLFLY